jgi:flagellar biosynthesis/type III secretory pathway protein FliH
VVRTRQGGVDAEIKTQLDEVERAWMIKHV